MEAEFKKVSEVVAKLTAPANRIGMLLEFPGEGLARILVGGAEYYANVDPRVPAADLKIGTQILGQRSLCGDQNTRLRPATGRS